MSSHAPAPSALDTTPLRFDVAHPNAPTKETTCSACAQQVRLEYFEVEGQVVCAACRAQVDSAQRDSTTRGRFAKAAALGALAAVAGAAVYGAFRMATGYDVGLVAILVGFIVGKAVLVGSGKRGGRRYQFLAIVLTYVAVSLSYAPIAVKELKEAASEQADSFHSVTSATAPEARSDKAAPAPRTKVGAGGILLAVGSLLLLVLSLPVLVGASSIISVLLLVFALMQAWRMNRAVQLRITGPYQIAVAPTAQTPTT